MSLGSTRKPPPLSLSLSTHPMYEEIVRIGKGGGKILDLGCGPGKDLLQLIKDGVLASNVVGMDKESGFQNILDASSRRVGISELIQFVSGDITTLLPGSEDPHLDSWFANNRGTFSVVVCNRLLHLLPSTQHSPLLALCLSQLLVPSSSSSSSTLLLVGLQRALPPSTSPSRYTSGWHSISSVPNPRETEEHWLWDSREWDALLASVCALETERRGGQGRVEWGSEFLDAEGLGEGRGAERWWIRVVDASS